MNRFRLRYFILLFFIFSPLNGCLPFAYARRVKVPSTIYVNIYGRRVILTEEGRQHIAERHPEVLNYLDRIWETVLMPDGVIKIDGQYCYEKYYSDLNLWLRVFTKITGVVEYFSTAYFCHKPLRNKDR